MSIGTHQFAGLLLIIVVTFGLNRYIASPVHHSIIDACTEANSGKTNNP